MKTMPEPTLKTASTAKSFEPPASFIALEAESAAVAPQPMQPAVMFDEDARNDGTLSIALMLTRRCNMTCAHCSVESSPHIKTQPSDDELVQVVRDAAQSGAFAVQLTGGEPMLREALVMRLLDECRTLGMGATLTTNAFWGKSPEAAARKIKALSDAGVGRLTISYDRFHAEFQGPEPAVNIIRAAEELDLPLTISLNLTRTVDDDLTALVAPFEKFARLQMRFYDVQPVGRARDMEGTLRQETGGFCTACRVPTVTDDGRVTACNGPSYFSAPNSPLIVGSLGENTFAELVEKHRSDPILDTIRTFGPSRLRRELRQTPGFEDFAFYESYSGMCDLCLHLTSQPQAMTALYERLSQSQPSAERIAAQYVMNAARHGQGELNRDYVNALGACRVFLRAALQPAQEWAEEAERILGRADLDWNHQALHLMRCGLSLPLQKALGETALSRWAPPFFIERLRRQALTDSFRQVAHRQALEQIAQSIREVGTRGVLLKGTAMMAIDDEFAASGIEYSKRVPGRSCGDVDLYIPRGQAIAVREKLLQCGFKDVEPAGADMTAWHQLPQMVYRGALVEIHQELQPDFCGLPERELLRHTRPLKSERLQGLHTLDAEGMLLYSAVHLSKHLFAHGLKTAWDFLWLMDRFPNLNWNRVANLARRTSMNRGFWVPLCVLCRELAIPVPESFLKRAPKDRRGRKMEILAHRHLFGTTKFVFEDNPWICQSLYAMLSDSWRHRARLVLRLMFGKESRRLRHERQQNDSTYGHNHLHKLRSALTKWRQLR